MISAEVIEARDEAMQAVETNANSARLNFTRDAKLFVPAYLRQHGQASGEVITDACKAAGIVPHDDRAFGPIYFALAKAEVIVKVAQVPREKGHGTSGGNVWALMETVQ